MPTPKLPMRQSSFDNIFNSPFTSVFQSVRGPQHEKALKQAFYNVAAILFVIVSGGVAVAVYFVMEAFIRPLLWAGLCGAFLHPFKRTLTSLVKTWLQSLTSTHTPLSLGTFFLPLQLINLLSNAIGNFIVNKVRWIIYIGISFGVIYMLYVFQPFLEILVALEKLIFFIYSLLYYFQNPLLVWTLVIGYVILVSFWWETASSTLCHLSVPVWLILLLHLASLAGPYQVPLCLFVVGLCILGAVAERHDSANEIDSSPKKHSTILSVAAALLGSEQTSHESTVESSPGSKTTTQTETSCNASSQGNESNEQSLQNKCTAAGKSIQSDLPKFNESDDVESIVRTPSVSSEGVNVLKSFQMKSKQKEKKSNPSDRFFVALFWACFMIKIWSFTWILQLFPILLLIFIIKISVQYSGLKKVLREKLHNILQPVQAWAKQRQDALVPAPVNGLGKLFLRGDKNVIKMIAKSIDKLISIGIILLLAVATVLVTVLLAVQVHNESVHLVTVTGNLVNDAVNNHPGFANWLPANQTDLSKSLESALHRGYLMSRKYFASKLHSVLGSQTNTTILEQNILEMADRIYAVWMGIDNQTNSFLSNNNSSSFPVRTSKLSNVSWSSVSSWLRTHEMLDVNVLISVVKENIDTLTSVLESIWKILKGNINLALNVITVILSLVFFSGSYLLNAGLSMVVFLTTLFYLLSSSGDQYKPVEWFSNLFASETSGFGEEVYSAIRGVFGASLKMASFYGLYTWFTHSLFGINIVYIPAAIAATTAMIPFIGTYWAAVPAVLELWLVHGQGLLAVTLAVCHLLPTYFVDTTIYSEISGGAHPYLTGLAVAGGIYCLGLEGAIVGPIVLCCLIVACNVYGKMIGNSSPVVEGTPTRLINE